VGLNINAGFYVGLVIVIVIAVLALTGHCTGSVGVGMN